MLYAPWNPVPWLLFLLGVAICVFSVKAFHRKYPDYPLGGSQLEVREDSFIPQSHDSYIDTLSGMKVLDVSETDISHHSSVSTGR
jgi:hypothetical protein